MKDSQVLSAFIESGAPPANAAPTLQQVLVFDACHVGVILRAILFVEVVTGVAAMFGAATFLDWLVRVSIFTAGVLPGSLLWLVVACLLKTFLGRLKAVVQQMAGVLLGAIAGVYACGILTLVGLLNPSPWVASAFSGAMLSAVLVAALVLRAKARAPAGTTARLGELQARIRPHFLFNTLNSAIALVRAQPREAERLLEDLSDLFRHALTEQGESVSLADEIALAQRYLAIEQVRFGDRIQVQWALDDQAAQARLPPLLLQPLVENAVKHGVEPSAQGGQIKISTQRRGTTVVIKVSNTVSGDQSQHGSGLALDNVRERLGLLHDVQSRFQSGFKDGMFQVRMEVPL